MPAKDFFKLVKISKKTLYNWEQSGKLIPIRTPTGRRFYTKEHYDTVMKMGKK